MCQSKTPKVRDPVSQGTVMSPELPAFCAVSQSGSSPDFPAVPSTAVQASLWVTVGQDG